LTPFDVILIVVCGLQMVSAVCQFQSVKSAVEATVAVKQSSIPVARIGRCSHTHLCKSNALVWFPLQSGWDIMNTMHF